MAEQKLIVTEIERSAIHDGPGLRTVVFLQGCPLSCYWCCNPETQSVRPVLLHDRNRCVGCGACTAVCPNAAVTIENGKAAVDRELCRACGACAAICPLGANSLSGKEMTVAEVLAVVAHDRAYFDATGGGLTLSGGEPLLQSAAPELLKQAKAAGISTAVETTACLSYEKLEAALPYIDRFYVDYKHPDAGALQRAANAFLPLIEENLRRLVRDGACVTLRTPVIPGFNDEETVLERCFAFAVSLGLREYVLLPYHSLGKGKYAKLDLPYSLGDLPILKPEDLAGAAQLGARMGLSVQIGG